MLPEGKRGVEDDYGPTTDVLRTGGGRAGGVNIIDSVLYGTVILLISLIMFFKEKLLTDLTS